MIVLGNFSKIGTFVVCILEFYLGQQIVVIAPTVLEKYANAFGPRCVSWLQLLQRKADHYHACFRVICHKVAHLSLQHIQVLFSNAGQMNFKITQK